MWGIKRRRAAEKELKGQGSQDPAEALQEVHKLQFNGLGQIKVKRESLVCVLVWGKALQRW